MSPQLIILFIALAIGIQPIATDLYLPALPDLTAGLGTTTAQAQLTLTALLLPFGISQLAWGPLSDRFGRRPILLAGLVLFSVGAVGCVFAQSITTLQAWRALEGIGMGAAVMTGRAVVRDAFAPSEGARVMSKALAGLGVLSCLGPLWAASWRNTRAGVGRWVRSLYLAARSPWSCFCGFAKPCQPSANRYWMFRQSLSTGELSYATPPSLRARC